MLKKIRKILSKDIKKRYEKLETRYLAFENRLYSTLEDRLTNLEEKFHELSELLKEELHSRKERNEEKLETLTHEEEVARVEKSSETPTEKEEVAKEAPKAEEKVAKPKAETAKEEGDDLTKIKGLGKVMAGSLAEEGITAFAQLAKLSAKKIEALDAKIKGFKSKLERYDWKQQAKDM